MRCQDCAKFVSYDESYDIEPGEIEEGPSPGSIICSFNITLCCAECGAELKSASDVEATGQIELPGDHETEDCELTFTDPECDPNSKTEGGGRRARMFYGALISARVSCECGLLSDEEISLVGHIQASEMEELT